MVGASLVATLESHTADMVNSCDVFIDREWARESRDRYVAWLCSMRNLPKKPRYFPSRVRKLVFDLLFANTAHRAITGDVDGRLSVWNLAERNVMYTLEGHMQCVTCCAVYANGTRAISGSYDRGSNSLNTWCLVDRSLLGKLNKCTRRRGVSCCSVFYDGTRAVRGSRDGWIEVWDLTNNVCMRSWIGHASTAEITCTAVCSGGTRAVSGSRDKTLRVWNLADGTLLRTLAGHTGAVACCSVFAEGTRAISGGHDMTLKLWDIADGTLLRTLEGHTHCVACCAVFFNDTRAIGGSRDHTLTIWNIVNGTLLHTLQGHGDWITCCAVFSNDTRMISGSHDGTLKVWRI